MACSNPHFDDNIIDSFGNKIPIPCGHCFCCRLDMQRSSIDRMHCAYFSHSCSAFVTFTYDDYHLVFNDGFRQPTLSKDDAHKYLDKIKHQLKGIDFEYYLCGEYGDRFNRPHYHALFFGLDYQLHEKFFNDSWKAGEVKVLPCSPQAFRYVTKYITKPYSKEWNDKNYYDLGMIPPFRKFSRGLGLSVYLNHLDEIDRYGFFSYHGRRIFVNRYYFNKLVSYSSRTVLNREEAIIKNNALLSESAARFGMPVNKFRFFKNEELEKSLRSKALNRSSKLT